MLYEAGKAVAVKQVLYPNACTLLLCRRSPWKIKLGKKITLPNEREVRENWLTRPQFNFIFHLASIGGGVGLRIGQQPIFGISDAVNGGHAVIVTLSNFCYRLRI